MGSRLENKSNEVRKRIESHTFENEEGEEYEPSKFGGFGDYFRRKKIKLQNLDAELRSQSAGNPNIFHGIVAHVNGYTQPSLNDLHKLIVTHGGGFMQYLDGKTTVTHIICSNLTPKKAVEFKRYRIVRPSWVIDSVKAGRLLPWDNYRVLAEGAGQRVLGFENGKVISQADAKSKGYKDESDKSWYASQLKAGSSQTPSTPRFVAQNPPTPEIEDDIDDDLFPSELGMPSATKSANKPALPASPSTSPLVDQNLRTAEELQDESHLSDKVPEFESGLTSESLKTNEEDALAQDIEGVTAANTDVRGEEMPERGDASLVPEVAVTEERYTRSDWSAPQDRQKKCKASEVDGSNSMTGGAGVQKTADAAKRAKITAEEHNAELLADPRIRKSTVVNPDFLEQYYRESRLHHLSTWKAELKAQLQAMANEKSASQQQRKKRTPGSRRYILHVDFDSFFAAVSLKKSPHLIDKPAVVAHGSGSASEIASCNYPARKYGIRNGMWMKRAQEMCPNLKVLPYDFPAYEEASKHFYEAISITGGLIQSVSIDEALVDVTDTCLEAAGSDGKVRAEGTVDREQSKADELAQMIRDEVKQRTDCNVSVGIGGNILLAKVALRKAKPAGQYHIRPEEVLDFIGKLEVQDLPGVAYSIGGKLEEIGIKYVKDVREFSREKLIGTLGPKTGEKIWEYARGIDRAEVGDVVVRKSVSAEVNWGVRFETQEQVEEFIESLCGELEKRLLKEHVRGKQFTMKIMKRAADAPLDPPKHLGHGKCDTFNKSMPLGVPTNAKEILIKEALSILKGYGFSPGELRGLGVQMTKLEPMKTNDDGQSESSQRRLQFKVQSTPKLPLKEPEDPITDDHPVTPKKPKLHPDDDDVGFGAEELYKCTPRRKPLNTAGTQFVVPTQIDPKVLEELPEDIRVKIAQHIDVSKFPSSANERHAPPSKGKSAALALPNQSQIDIESFNALPVDVRDEILAFYNHDTNVAPSGSPSIRKHRDQSVLPQSPRKVRTVAVPKKPIPAPAALRKRGRPSKFAVSARGNSTLTQSNFIAGRFVRTTSPDGAATGTDTDNAEEQRPESRQRSEADGDGQDDSAEISAEFLAALPEDIRREVLDEQQRQRLKKTSSLNLQRRSRKKTTKPQPGSEDDEEPQTQRLLKLPPRLPKPTFTVQKLSSLPDLRDAVCAWWEEFRKEGPYDEDVNALVAYLEKVVLEERDMIKAVGVVKWMTWIVQEGLEDTLAGETNSPKGRDKWLKALDMTRGSVREAVKRRGLGDVEF